MFKEENMDKGEKEFLDNFRAEDYKRPSVTADIVIFTLDEDNDLNILLINRKGYPFKDHWALPGGFLQVDEESTDETAERELYEETGINNVFLKQLYTFSKPDRDPRTHVISVAYTALIPKSKLTIKAGDDAKDARLFKIKYDIDGINFTNSDLTLTEKDLAFDHKEIIRTAITRIRGRIDYEPDAFELLKDKSEFTIYELKCIHESIKNETLDTANFRKSFIRNYLNTGFCVDLGRKCKNTGKRAAELYAVNE